MNEAYPWSLAELKTTRAMALREAKREEVIGVGQLAQSGKYLEEGFRLLDRGSSAESLMKEYKTEGKCSMALRLAKVCYEALTRAKEYFRMADEVGDAAMEHQEKASELRILAKRLTDQIGDSVSLEHHEPSGTSRVQ